MKNWLVAGALAALFGPACVLSAQLASMAICQLRGDRQNWIAALLAYTLVAMKNGSAPMRLPFLRLPRPFKAASALAPGASR